MIPCQTQQPELCQCSGLVAAGALSHWDPHNLAAHSCLCSSSRLQSWLHWDLPPLQV